MINGEDFQQFEAIFHPRSIAVVGASEDPVRPGGAFFQNLVTAGFKGGLYPVNLKGGKIGEYDVYRHLTDIPHPVDLVIVSIPRDGVLNVLEECAAKRVKGVNFFTAGFGELGDARARELEEHMLRLARRGGFRIVGPNSAGIACPSCAMPIGPEGFLGQPGDIAFLSQSGSLSLELVQAGMRRGLGFSKIVSLGNGLDLDSPDYLRYFAEDPQTRTIAMYLEGVQDGRLLLRLMKSVSRKKPVLLLKGGKGQAGLAAAQSHTAAMASSEAIWKAAARQSGALWMEGFNELVDTLVALQRLPQGRLKGIAVVSGLADGGGGTAIVTADLLAAAGLNIPQFSSATRDRLKSVLGAVGSILQNPLDISQVQGRFQSVEAALAAASGDSHIDLVLIYENLYTLSRWHSWERILDLNRMMVRVCREQKKALAVILPPEMMETRAVDLEGELSRQNVPVYPSAERATKALAQLKQYYRGT
ncbi:MAG: CoA binding protein [Dehalococcoidia bacterium]|nr:CoA binding protein [Dehalococcoidia bacterium]